MTKLSIMIDGYLYYEHVVIRRCSSLIRRLVATSRSKGVLPQSWVVGDSYIVARSTERTRTLNLGEYTQDTGRNISSSRLHYFSLYFSRPLDLKCLIAGHPLWEMSHGAQRCSGVDSLLWTQMTEFTWTHSWKVSEIKNLAFCSYCLTFFYG